MAPNRKTLLLVDADESARERLANILKRDARVLRAGSAEGALTMLGRDGVDLVLSDAALPGVSGFDSTRSNAVGGAEPARSTRASRLRMFASRSRADSSASTSSSVFRFGAIARQYRAQR